jgi:hypothetical protein
MLDIEIWSSNFGGFARSAGLASALRQRMVDIKMLSKF